MSLSDKKKVLAQLQFIHQRLSQTSQYFIDEFEIARDSVRTITDMFNQLQEEVNAEQKALEGIASKGPGSEKVGE
jgi:hypothetical protein